MASAAATLFVTSPRSSTQSWETEGLEETMRSWLENWGWLGRDTTVPSAGEGSGAR